MRKRICVVPTAKRSMGRFNSFQCRRRLYVVKIKRGTSCSGCICIQTNQKCNIFVDFVLAHANSNIKKKERTSKEEDTLGLFPSVLALDETPCIVEAGLLCDILALTNVLLLQNLW